MSGESDRGGETGYSWIIWERFSLIQLKCGSVIINNIIDQCQCHQIIIHQPAIMIHDSS